MKFKLFKTFLTYKLLILAFCLSTSVAEPEKIIIDADVGIDDAMAILLAGAAPEALEIIGITTVFGNASIENGTRNALYLSSLMKGNIPVAQGASVPLVAPPKPPTDFVHGDNGLGNISYPDDGSRKPVALSAAEFIIEQSHKYPGELTLVPVGRMTNIALALRLDPDLPKRIKRVVIMGGAVQVPGNVTPVAEANIIGDPEAADIILGADWDITVIGLDVTLQVIISPADLDALEAANAEVGGFIKSISDFYMDFYRSIGLTGGFYVHDPSAILYLLKPEFFETAKASVRVATEGIAMGQTIAAFPPHDTRDGPWKGVPPARIAVGVDSIKAQTYILEKLATLKLADTD